MTSNSKLIPYLWLSWLLLGVFGSYIYFISNPSPIISKQRRCLCPNWKWLNRWLCHKLYYWIIRHCRLRPRHHPPFLGGSFFSSYHCNKHQRWRRGGACDRALFERHWMDQFFSGCKDIYRSWEFECVSKTVRDSFYDGDNIDFLQLQRLMSSFTNLDHVANLPDLTHIEKNCVARY